MSCEESSAVFFRDDRPFMMAIIQFSEWTRRPLLHVIVIIIALGLLQLVFHIFITTRRSMKALNTRGQLQVLLASATLTCFVDFARYSAELISEYQCEGTHSYLYALLNMLEPFAWSFPHQTTIWTMVYVTIYRVNIVLENRFGARFRIKTSLTLVVCVVCASPVVISEFIRSLELYVVEIEDVEEKKLLMGGNCTVTPDTHLYDLVNRKFECSFERVRSFLSVIMGELIPCIILIVSTVFLIVELNRNQDLRDVNAKKKSTSRVKTLVVFLFFFLAAEIPLMFIFGVGMISEADFYALDDRLYVHEDCYLYICLSCGYFQYCVMSSQYRNTVKVLFRRKRRVKAGSVGHETVPTKVQGDCFDRFVSDSLVSKYDERLILSDTASR